MKKFLLEAEKLTDWKSFHKEFKSVLAFPDYYGENMDAWIDCMDELSTDDQVLIQIENGKMLKDNAPDILSAILECAAFVNYRKIDAGEEPSLLVSIFV